MKGHPLRGIFGGFFFGLFLGFTLWFYGVIDFASNLMWILPLVFIVVGLALAAWAPFGSGEPASPPATEGTPQADATEPDGEEQPQSDTLEMNVTPDDEPGEPTGA